MEGGVGGRQPPLTASPLLSSPRWPGPVRFGALTPAAPRRGLAGADPSPQPSFLRQWKPDTGTAPRSPCGELRLCPGGAVRPLRHCPAARPCRGPARRRRLRSPSRSSAAGAPRPHHAMCPAEPGGTRLLLAPHLSRPSVLPGQGPAGRQLAFPRREARSVPASGLGCGEVPGHGGRAGRASARRRLPAEEPGRGCSCSRSRGARGGEAANLAVAASRRPRSGGRVTARAFAGYELVALLSALLLGLAAPGLKFCSEDTHLWRCLPDAFWKSLCRWRWC